MLHERHKDAMTLSIGLNSCFLEKIISVAVQRMHHWWEWPHSVNQDRFGSKGSLQFETVVWRQECISEVIHKNTLGGNGMAKMGERLSKRARKVIIS